MSDYTLGFEAGILHNQQNHTVVTKPPVLTTKMLLDNVVRLKYAAQYELLTNLISNWGCEVHNNRVLNGDSEKSKLLSELIIQLKQMKQAISRELEFHE